MIRQKIKTWFDEVPKVLWILSALSLLSAGASVVFGQSPWPLLVVVLGVPLIWHYGESWAWVVPIAGLWILAAGRVMFHPRWELLAVAFFALLTADLFRRVVLYDLKSSSYATIALILIVFGIMVISPLAQLTLSGAMVFAVQATLAGLVYLAHKNRRIVWR